MGPEVLDFKPNGQLINVDFEGYKLSLKEIPTAKRELHKNVYRAIPNSSQYGYLHAKLFSTHNHLIGESIDDNDVVYFVDNDWKIQKVVYDLSATNEIEISEVFEIPRNRSPENGDFNVSLKFVNDKLAVVSDGMGLLYVIEINNAQNDCGWQAVFSEEVLIPNKHFIVQDVKLRGNNLYCLLYSIISGDNNDRFLNVLNLITLSKDGKVWGQTAIKELKAGGGLHYAFIESSCTAIYIISEKNFKFTLDSDNPIEQETVNLSKIAYFWTQSDSSVTITFKLPESCGSGDIIVHTTSTSISCKYKNQTYLNGTLHKNIDSTLTNWKLWEDVLEITLIKVDEGNIWTELIPGDENGEFIADPALAAGIREKLSGHNRVSEQNQPMGTTFNNQQVEECDFEGDTYTVFERLCCTSHKVTHRYNIDTHKIVLIVKRPGDVPSIALRHDVDAYLWQPVYENGDFSLKHFGTLNAFGYVEASKQQKKFIECAPDLSYSVICESNRHVFIYRQKNSIESGELRNRITGRQVGVIAQQQVVNIPEEIIGVYASNHKLFLLTNNTLFVLRM